MILFLQYTFADFRRINGNSEQLLTKPTWPSPLPQKEFVKYSGQIVQRSKLGIDNWIGETYLCRINRGIRVPEQSPPNYGIRIKCVGKHQFSIDNRILTKFEFIFSIKNYGTSIINSTIISEVLNTVLEETILIRNESGYTANKFKDCIKALKEFYILNTTKSGRYKMADEVQQIESCLPQVFVALEHSEFFKAPSSQYGKISSEHIRELYSSLKKFNNRPYKIWIHQRTTSISLITINRKFRISILRLYSEYECLKSVLRFITANKITVDKFTESSETLNAYLNRATKTILKDTRSLSLDYSDTDYIAEFTKIFSTLNPGELDAIREKIEQIGLRRQIEQKVTQIITNNLHLAIMEQKNEFNNSQVGAVGFNATATGNTFIKNEYSLPEQLDYNELTRELSSMKKQMKEQAQAVNEYTALAEIAKAEEAASKKDGNNMVKHLKAAGSWAIDFASKVGASIVAEIIKKNTGI